MLSNSYEVHDQLNTIHPWPPTISKELRVSVLAKQKSRVYADVFTTPLKLHCTNFKNIRWSNKNYQVYHFGQQSSLLEQKIKKMTVITDTKKSKILVK